MGVWLPLALADIYAALVNVIRMWARNGGEIEAPTRSESLASWMLPMMAASLRAEEKKDKAKVARAMFAALNEKYGAAK